MSGEVKACGACGSRQLMPLFDMGFQPLAESSGPSRAYPLALVRCLNCYLVQLDYIADPEDVFKPDHPYSTGNSGMLRAHYEQLAKELEWNRLKPGDVVVDIGANDGTLLSYYSSFVHKVAVEPTDQILKCPADVDRWQGFFTNDLACDMLADPDIGVGPAKVITACNVLAHVPDPHDFLDGVYTLLAEDGVFVTENHDLASITDGLQIDTVYHEHLRYYSVGSLSFLLERHGLRIVSSHPVPTHGGSFRVTARRMGSNFPRRAKNAATALRAMLYQITEQRRQKVYGIGAATRATPLIHYAGIREFITCVCEVSGSDKIGTRMPGTQIPVVDEKRLLEDQPPYALLFSWHMADYIAPKLREAGYKGKFIVPLPRPKVLDD
jgi:hypothetical protein